MWLLPQTEEIPAIQKSLLTEGNSLTLERAGTGLS